MSYLFEELRNKAVVVTGASGYIGSALINKLQKYNCKIIRTSRTTLIPIDGVQDKILDLTSKESWIEIVSNADIIFHLAGNTSIALLLGFVLYIFFKNTSYEENNQISHINNTYSV